MPLCHHRALVWPAFLLQIELQTGIVMHKRAHYNHQNNVAHTLVVNVLALCI